MELTQYLTQIIISAVLFTIMCIIAKPLKKITLPHLKSDLKDYFPIEEILTFKQMYYLILIACIYFCIMNFFLNRLNPPASEIIMIASIVDIIISVYITVSFYDGSTKSRIISVFMFPLTSIAYLAFGGPLIRYWDFIRIPALLYLVVHYYHEFLGHTKENGLDKLILLLISVIYISMVLTLIVQNQNPINALGMVSYAFTSNGYIISDTTTTGGILVSTLLVWSGYIISGVATATLAAAIVLRNSNEKFESLQKEYQNLEKIIGKTPQSDEMNELKRQLESIHDENAELKREIVELKEMIKNK